MAQEVPPYLFVYGTLKSDARGMLGARERARLAREGTSMGQAFAAGLLYDLGAYPGLYAAARAGPDAVSGELIRLFQPLATFAWLDAYEGVGPAFPKAEYARGVVDVRLQTGFRSLRAWTYLLVRRPVACRRIETGIWLADGGGTGIRS